MEISSVKLAHQMAIERNVKLEEERQNSMAHD
jgi:hypothetical protein